MLREPSFATRPNAAIVIGIPPFMQGCGQSAPLPKIPEAQSIAKWLTAEEGWGVPRIFAAHHFKIAQDGIIFRAHNRPTRVGV